MAAATATQTGNSEELRAVLMMIKRLKRANRITSGADKSSQEESFVRGLRGEQAVSHVAEYAPNPK